MELNWNFQRPDGVDREDVFHAGDIDIFLELHIHSREILIL